MPERKPDKKKASAKSAAKKVAGKGAVKKAAAQKPVAKKATAPKPFVKKATASRPVTKKTAASTPAKKEASQKTAYKKTADKKTVAAKAPDKKAQKSSKQETVKQKPAVKNSRFVSDPSRKYDEFIEPMLATLAEQPFDDAEWIFEMKWDGYRAIAEWRKKKLKLYSRNGLSFVQKYPPVAEAITKLNHDCVLDGEIVVLNEKGRPRFQMLQEYEQDPRHPLHYYVFDLLFLDGKDLRELPLINRKELLKKLLDSYKGDVIRYSDHVSTSGKKFFHHVKKLDFEGMMAKKADSEYYSGIRTREWLKVKHLNNQEAVIVGFTAPRRSRKFFGALILGEFKGRSLQYIGHTGTGFNHTTLKELWNLMQPLITTQSPFAEKVKVNAPVTWIKPSIVCEVKFTEQTNEGILRHPVFLGLREDKAAKEVTQNNDK